ncbi:hypothetical protein F2Q68_00006818 [Brassica cretica]|uniref:UBC core domain-containing protein n=1 Tax=Brassica cretica TaxID=69181 RepID=A0A8S9JJT3_BRACR|nr:hypothetical protein F2Q68_00006818 [Brassica cretica]
MAGNDWVNSYLEAILDVGQPLDDARPSLLLRERGRFTPSRYFVEEVITGYDETDLHRSWVKAVATRSPQERNTRLENMCWRIWNLARQKKQKVHYHSGGLRINPNLYNCGKVCLSLLGTWTGNKREKWLPQESTMFQLLVSIQALILNQKPYFNEPGYEPTKGTVSGEAHAKVYSENVFILSLKTMVYSMRKPPKHFEEFVHSHYFVRALDIVKACNAYKDGAPVGSILKGGVQGIEETSQSGSKKFRTDVAAFMKTVVGEFVKLGINELEEKPKPPPVVNANTDSNTANRKRSRSSR